MASTQDPGYGGAGYGQGSPEVPIGWRSRPISIPSKSSKTTLGSRSIERVAGLVAGDLSRRREKQDGLHSDMGGSCGCVGVAGGDGGPGRRIQFGKSLPERLLHFPKDHAIGPDRSDRGQLCEARAFA